MNSLLCLEELLNTYIVQRGRVAKLFARRDLWLIFSLVLINFPPMFCTHHINPKLCSFIIVLQYNKLQGDQVDGINAAIQQISCIKKA